MTNYNERPDGLTRFMKSIDWEFDENGYTFEDNYINFRTAEMLRQAITSLIKELVAEAKPPVIDTPSRTKLYADDEGQMWYDRGQNDTIARFEQNLLKALEEV